MVEVRPRERMILGGEGTLSTEELIAILLRTGGNGKNVLKLAEEISEEFPSLVDLANASLEELMNIKGVGLAKATSLKAALELGKRLHEEMVKTPRRLRSPSDVYNLCSDMRFKNHEILRIIALDNSLAYISHRDFSSSLSSVVDVSRRDLFRYLLRVGASGFLVVHNHPTNPDPSENDVEVTKSLKKAGDILGLKLVDHVIIGKSSYRSLREEGLI